MFGWLFRQAQETVETTIDYAIARVVVALPFIVAAGFAIAALTLFLIRSLGGEAATLIMAAAFTVVGLIAMATVHARASRQNASSQGGGSAEPGGQTTDATGSETSALGLDTRDREAMLAALTAVGPMALPHLLRLVFRNIPILAAGAAAIYVLARSATAPEPESAPRVAPAE